MVEYDRTKHLELISKAIERMDKSAGSLKALSPAAIGVALLLIDKKIPAWLALAASAIAVLVYWYQDARFLGRERAFRQLYDQARRGELDNDPYVMDIGKLVGRKAAWDCMWVGSVVGVHGTALVMICAAFVWLSLLAK
jgi:hypothetical protein